ncbi:TetR/AcrR family transcriptional regulator [Camelimonas sp. ID_303_24]
MSATDARADAKSGRPEQPARERIIEALLAIAGEREAEGASAWSRISINDIAERAGVSLAEFLAAFPSKGAVLGGFARMIDMKVLASHAARDDDMGGEPARERLFDIIMMRLDHMAAHRAGLRVIHAGVRREPLTIAALNKAAQNSWRFMLSAAGIDTEGPLGALRVQGAALLFAHTVETWLYDDDPGQAKTLARLDRELDRGGRALALANDAWRLTSPLRRLACAVLDRGGHKPRRPEPAAPAADAGEAAPEAR